MDNLCHTLLGAALGKAGLARRTRLGMSTLLIASNLPDIDVAVFATNTVAVSFRRGWTHGVLAQAALPLLLAGGMAMWGRRRPGEPPVRFSELALLSYVGVLSHVFLDFLNSYGVRLLMPFSPRWFYGDALVVVDPWLYVMLGANVVARGVVAEGLGRAGRATGTRFMVTPVFGNPFRREVVIDMGDRYEKGVVWFDPMPHFRPAGFGIDTRLQDPEVQAAIASPRAQAFLMWSRFPFAAIDNGTSPPRVWLNDYRYASTGPGGWSAFATDVTDVTPR